ncbi:MAG: hypothetical protein WAO35_03740 [Terriglobia bacterium]
MAKATGFLPQRRSARVNAGCRVRVSGTLANNEPFTEETEIVTVSKYGAKLKTQIPLQVEMQLKIQPLRGANSGIFKVVWVGRKGTLRAGEVGVACTKETADILGINFPA